MKRLTTMGLAACLILSSVVASVWAGQDSTQAPPVAQPLVREGDFAVKLAEALKIGHAETEAEAEYLLALAGILPLNGWIADYPVTPQVFAEIWNATDAAADTAKLSMTREEAEQALREIATEQGIPFAFDAENPDGSSAAAPEYGQYGDRTLVQSQYDDQGPPVVTYYPPPPDYDTLYSWVPCSFWWSDLWFPGFFVLNDFHTIIVVKKVKKVVSNHWMKPHNGKMNTVNSSGRMGNGRRTGSADGFVAGAPKNPGAGSGGESILKRSLERNRGAVAGADRQTGDDSGALRSGVRGTPGDSRQRVDIQDGGRRGTVETFGHTDAGRLEFSRERANIPSGPSRIEVPSAHGPAFSGGTGFGRSMDRGPGSTPGSSMGRGGGLGGFRGGSFAGNSGRGGGGGGGCRGRC